MGKKGTTGITRSTAFARPGARPFSGEEPHPAPGLCVNTGCVICLLGPAYAEVLFGRIKDLFLSQNFNDMSCRENHIIK